MDKDVYIPRAMGITGKSALYALGIALIGVVLLTMVYSLMAAIVGTSSSGEFDIGLLLGRAYGFIQVLGLCAGPVIFLLSFALLQRFRIR